MTDRVYALVCIADDHVRVFWRDNSPACDVRDQAAIDLWRQCQASGEFRRAAGGMARKSAHLIRDKDLTDRARN